MDERTATNIAVELKALVQHFNALGAASEGIADDDERRKFRAALGKLMVSVDADLIRPVATQYPHLDPVEGH
jgi:hypothetical protein